MAHGQGTLRGGARPGGSAARPAARAGAAAHHAAAHAAKWSLAELYEQPKAFWETIIIWGCASTAAYGVYLWGPTIVSLLLHISVPQAAGYFVFVAGAGIIGKVVVSIVSPMMGRRRCGQLWGFLAAIALAAAAWFNDTFVGGVPLLVVFLCCSTFGIDGSFANLAPYTVEVFGVRLGARSSGLGQAANGVGKILGPLSLALIAGTGNIVSPHATAEAVLPAFMFLAFAMVLVGLSFTALGMETHGVPIRLHEQMADQPAEEACSRAPRQLAAAARATPLPRSSLRRGHRWRAARLKSEEHFDRADQPVLEAKIFGVAKAGTTLRSPFVKHEAAIVAGVHLPDLEALEAAGIRPAPREIVIPADMVVIRRSECEVGCRIASMSARRSP